MDCFKVETPTATYVYGKKGAGFASILDKDGRDWISYRPGDKAKGEYRGLPKCGQPTKFFHCGYGYGHVQDRRTSSQAASPCRSADHVRIESETADGKSACAWDFYPDHATMTLLRIDLPTYWFLYEGTPGGKLDADKDFVIRPDGTKTTLDKPWSQVVPWVCFGAAETPGRLRLRQPPGAGEGRDRLVRLLAVPEGGGRVVPGHDGVRLRAEGIQGAGRARPRPEAAAGPVQHRVRGHGGLQDGQGRVRGDPPDAGKLTTCGRLAN